MELNDITGIIVDECFQIQQGLGPGLLESVYETVLARRLVNRGLRVERQKLVSFEFDGMRFDDGLRIDLLVEGQVVVELKSVEQFAPVHGKQVLIPSRNKAWSDLLALFPHYFTEPFAP